MGMSWLSIALVMAVSRSVGLPVVNQAIRTTLAPVFAISRKAGIPSRSVQITILLTPRKVTFSPHRSYTSRPYTRKPGNSAGGVGVSRIGVQVVVGVGVGNSPSNRT